MAHTESTMLELGTLAPDFMLPNVVSGKTVHRDDFKGKDGLLVMFICPHCPYVKHIEQTLGALGADYALKPLAIVAISSNDVTTHPADSPEGMKAQAQAHGFVFPYLYDESQDVAHAYNAACTPDFFLFDKDFRLVYRGQYDASRPGSGIPVTGEDLRGAIDAVLADNLVPPDQRPSLGCNIKWKA
jgi:peroxiredoxin